MEKREDSTNPTAAKRSDAIQQRREALQRIGIGLGAAVILAVGMVAAPKSVEACECGEKDCACSGSPVVR